MKIQKLFGNKGAREATGLVVVIDIVRAATVQACALSQGAEDIISVATVPEAFDLKKKNPEVLLMGENGGYTINGFDFGNSPTEILKQNFHGKVLVHRSSAGTQGLVNAVNADELIFGSFVTASAIVTEIEKQKPEYVSFVITESEDEVFADYMLEKLRGNIPDMEKLKNRFYIDPGIEWFLDEDRKQFPVEDLHIALEIDKFNFFCKVTKEDGLLITRMVS